MVININPSWAPWRAQNGDIAFCKLIERKGFKQRRNFKNGDPKSVIWDILFNISNGRKVSI